MCPCQARLRREILRAFWQAHFTQWLAGDLNQREYCEANGLSLRQFGNWRAEFKYEHLVSERRVLWKRGEGVSHGLSHAASHATREKTILKPKPPRPPAVAATVAAATNFAMHRRNFSQKAKEAIVLETLKPGTTVTDVARRYQIAPRVLFRWRADMALGTPDVEPGFATVSVSSEENLPGVEVKS